MTAPIAPQWLNPSAPGQLSNKRGANTGADLVSLQLKYANPRASADPAGTLRIQATKPSAGGPQVVAWDSWWMGAGTAANIPDSMDVTPNAQFVYDPGTGPRVYIAHANNNIIKTTLGKRIFSAPINGPSLGKWREEQFPGTALPTGIHGLVQANGYAYATSNLDPNLWYAPINGDGTFGTWTILTKFGWNAGEMTTFTDSTGSFIYGFCPSAALNTWAARVNGDGTLTTVPGPALPANRSYCGAYVAPSGNNDGAATLFLIGGGGLATIVKSAITGGTTMAAWAATVTGLPAARTNMAFAALTVAGTPPVWLYVIGGSSDATLHGVPTNTVYRIQASTLGGAWTTDAATTPVVQSGGGGVPSQPPGGSLLGNVQIWCLGPISTGFTGGGPNCVQVNVNSSSSAVAGFVGSAATGLGKGTGAALAVGDLGASAVLTTNPDGSQTITVSYGAIQVQSTVFSANIDGDVITLAAYATDNVNGDPSPTSLTVMKIGQPPTITNITELPANDGRPTIAFNFNSGAGGGSEFSYRVQIAPSGWDSGTRYDSLNQVQIQSAPYLATAVAQTITVTVFSTDSPMTGQVVSATATLPFTPTLVGPGTPTGLTVTPNHAAASMTLAWTNVAPAGTTPANRVYYRRTGSSPWFLLFDSVGAITTVTIMDQLALGVAYDFAVSQVDNNNHSESVLSNIVTNKIIDPVVGGYSGFLHVQGTGADQSTPLAHGAALLVQGSPDGTAVRDTTATLPFQQLTPVVTLGVAHFVKLKLTVLVPTLANRKAIIDVLTTAYAGGVLIYRDGLGSMIACQIDPEQLAHYVPPVASELELNLTQIPNQFSNSAAQGSATGYPSQLFGSLVPLDPAEALL